MENKIEIILGLDVSTKTIGICLYNNTHEKIIKLTHVAPKISKNIKGIEASFLKKNIFENEFLLKYKDIGIQKIIIEEPLLRSNNVHTIANLLRFNSLIAESCYRILNIIPQFISSYDARKYSYPELMGIRRLDKKGNPYDKKKIIQSIKESNLTLFADFKWDIDKKQVMLDMATSSYCDISWIHNKNGDLKQENFDVVDSLVCILGWLHKEQSSIETDFKIIDNKISEDGKYIEYTFTSPVGNIAKKIML
jgi:hypothetical protein